jgi:hypothetical protein
MPAPGPNASYAEKRQWITEPNKDFGKYISAEFDTDVLEHNTAHLTVKDKSYTLEEQIHKDFLNIGSLDSLSRTSTTNPQSNKEPNINQNASPPS